MTKIRIVGLAAAALISLAACATPVAETATISAGEVSPDGSVVSCRTIEVIGSRFGERTCKSEEAWATFDAMMAKDARENADRFQRVGTGAATSGGG